MERRLTGYLDSIQDSTRILVEDETQNYLSEEQWEQIAESRRVARQTILEEFRRLRAALEQYADPRNWTGGDIWEPDLEGWGTAQQALHPKDDDKPQE